MTMKFESFFVHTMRARRDFDYIAHQIISWEPDSPDAFIVVYEKRGQIKINPPSNKEGYVKKKVPTFFPSYNSLEELKKTLQKNIFSTARAYIETIIPPHNLRALENIEKCIHEARENIEHIRKAIKDKKIPVTIEEIKENIESGLIEVQNIKEWINSIQTRANSISQKIQSARDLKELAMAYRKIMEIFVSPASLNVKRALKQGDYICNIFRLSIQ